MPGTLPPMDKPHGRESVRAALIEAGARLFAERGPNSVSVREVAREAGVNHGLVHRHFGSKDGLLQAVMTRLSGEVAESIGPVGSSESLADLLMTTFGATRDGAHWRILARSLLDGVPVRDLQEDFPVVRRMLEAARRGTRATVSPEALVTLMLSVGLGLLLFEPYLMEATAQDEERWQATRMELAQLALQASQSEAQPTASQSSKK
ncbi:MAG: helix-turn-helix domain-containing protein [Myxococcota bacterium]|nr:helix-turn-helix domain-containing protein [Myxococcota bacterium]